MSDQIDSSNTNSDSDSQNESIERIAEEFLEQLKQGGGQQIADWIGRHPDLAPELEARLLEVEGRYLKGKRSDFNLEHETRVQESNDEISLVVEKLIDVCCPNCGAEIHLVERVDTAEVTCYGCGSTIEVQTDRTYSRPAPVSRHIGRFRLLDVLGQGGFGTVYKAYDPKLDRAVALKVPRLGFFNSANQRARFIREAKNAARLRHDNIVQVYEILEDGELPVIVTEYIEGLTLSDLCSSRRLKPKESAELVAKLADAVQFAHDNGVIHRDLKPSNVLLNSELKPHIADFGLARDLYADITMTVDGEILGTPAYMSPEQARGDNSLTDNRTDVYSLGVVLFQLLTNELPFRGSRRMLMHQVINEDAQPVRKLNDSVPRELEVITSKSLAKDKELRFDSAMAMADDLRRFLANRPILAKPEGIFRRIVKWHRRQPLVSSLIVTVTSLLILGGILATVWALRERSNGVEIQQSLETNQEYLRRIFVQNGSALLNSNQSLSSLSWYQRVFESEDQSNFENDSLRFRQIVDNNPTLANVWGIGDRVGMAQFSKDGNRIIATDDESTLVVIDVSAEEQDKAPILHRLNHSGKIRRAGISNSGELAVCVVEQSVHLWSVETGQRVALLKHDAAVLSAEFSNDSSMLVTGSMGGKTIVWNTTTGEQIKEFVYTKGDEPDVNKACFSADGKKLVTVSSVMHSTIRIWDFESGKIDRLLTHNGRVSSIKVSESFEWFVSGSDDEHVKAWDLSNKESEPLLLDHKSPIRHVEIVDDSTVVSLAYDGSVKRWNLAKNEVSGFLVNRNITTMFAATGLSGEIIITACTDGDVRANWTKTGAAVCGRLPHGTTAMCVDFHPDGRRFVAGGNDGALRQWDLAGLAPAALLQHKDSVLEAVWSNDSKKVVTCSLDKSARVWDAQKGESLGKQLGPALEHDDGISDVDFLMDQSRVVTSSFDKSVKVWDLSTGQATPEKFDHLDGVFTVASSPTKQDHFVSGTNSGNGIGWGVPNGEKRFSFSHGAKIQDLVYSKSGKFIASSSLDGIVNLWDESGNRIGGPLKHEGAIHFLDFDRDETFLVTSGDARIATIWKLSDLTEPFQTLPHLDSVWGAAFSHDGSMILSTDIQGTATVWENADNQFEKKWNRQLSSFSIGYGDFSSDDKVVALSAFKPSSKNRRVGACAVILLDTKTGDELSPPLPMLDRIRRVRFSPRSDTLISVSNDSTARIWILDQSRLDPVKTKVLANTLTGKDFDNRMELISLSSSQIEKSFKEAKSAFPKLFQTSDREIQNWNQYVKFVLNSNESE